MAAVTAAAMTSVTAAAKAETEIDCEMPEMPKKMEKEIILSFDYHENY
jgi:hypothetical protein